MPVPATAFSLVGLTAGFHRFASNSLPTRLPAAVFGCGADVRLDAALGLGVVVVNAPSPPPASIPSAFIIASTAFSVFIFTAGLALFKSFNAFSNCFGFALASASLISPTGDSFNLCFWNLVHPWPVWVRVEGRGQCDARLDYDQNDLLLGLGYRRCRLLPLGPTPQGRIRRVQCTSTLPSFLRSRGLHFSWYHLFVYWMHNQHT